MTSGPTSGWGYPVISADSHITEAPGTYVDHIDAAWRDKAPRIESSETHGDVFVIDGMDRPIALGLVAAAGKPPEEIRVSGVRFEDLHRGGWDPHARLADQDRDGVAAEVIYPTVGMQLCNHPDFDYKHACFEAYNRWVAQYCAAHPDRLLGAGQTAMRTVDDGIADLHAIAGLGLRGVMMPGQPGESDYDDPSYAPFWEAAIELGLPLSFHILTMRSGRTRGPAMNGFLSIVRGCQDIIGMLVLGGVFERHPDLRVVCAEADAGWVPHFAYRMDHAYKRHRYWLPPGQELSKLPSEYLLENVYVTFQDDWTAFRFAQHTMLGGGPDPNARIGGGPDPNALWRRLLWANDFPHSDSTWPWSQELLVEHTAHLTDEQRQAILSENAASLYGVSLAAA